MLKQFRDRHLAVGRFIDRDEVHSRGHQLLDLLGAGLNEAFACEEEVEGKFVGGGCESRADGRAKARVEDHAHFESRVFDIACGQHGIIAQHRVDPDEDGLAARTQSVNRAPRGTVADLQAQPAGPGDFEIGGLCPLEGDAGTMEHGACDERGDELSTFSLEFIRHAIDDNARVAQHRDPVAVHIGIRIETTDDDARQLRLDKTRRTGRGLLVGMATRFERHIRGRAFGRFSAIRQGIRLGMRATKLGMIALADDAIVFDDDATHHRIRLDAARGRSSRGE